MKTLGLTTAKMQLAIVLLLAILAVQALAKPLAPYWDTNAEQDDYNTQLLHRSKRAAIVQSDYSFEAFHLRPSWRSSGCNGTYNCAPVTPSHCTDDSSNFFCLDEARTTPFGCELNFTVLVDEGATAEGVELALYKKAETVSGSYIVFIIYRKLGGKFHSNVAATRSISSSCKSWQVFDVSSIKGNIPVGVHKFNLLVAAFNETKNPDNPPIMTCNEVKSLFVMDTSADIYEFKGIEPPKPATTESETPAELEVDDYGKEKSNNGNEMEDNKTKTVEIEASGSSEEEGLVLTTTNTPSPPTVEDSNVLQVEAFLPVVNVFVRGGPNPLEKRSAIDTNEQNKTDIDLNKGEDVVPDTVSVAEEEDRDESSGANCRLLEHKIDLPALDPDVLQPDIVDVGKCSNSTNTVECKPTAFKNLMVLLKRTGEIEVSSIEIRENYIITECTPIAKTQPSVDEFTSSGLNPLRKRRFVDTSKTKSTQKMREDKDEITSSSASETATELDHEDSTTVASNCTLLENKIRLSTINQNILVPEIVDFGKCSGSTDVVECRPTGFQNLFVLLKMNDGTISFNSLPNAITTECTPYFNTPTV